MSLREYCNTEGQNKGKLAGDRLAIDVNASMTKSYTANGSILLGCVGSSVVTPELLNNIIDVEGKLTKRVSGDNFIISSLDLEDWIVLNYYNKTDINVLFNSYYTKTQTDNLFLNYYTKLQVDNLFLNYYTQTEINTLLGDYATIDSLELNYFDKTYITSNYYDKTHINDNYYDETESDNRFININQKGVALGVCPLDAGGKVAMSYLPSAIMTYEGLFNATTNVPELHQPNDNPLYNSGSVFIVENTTNPTTWNGIILRSGDWLILDPLGIWQKSENTDDLIISFNGRVGAVEPLSTDYSTFYYLKSEVYTKTEIDTNFYTKNYIGNNCVFNTGNQTIGGIKTFTNGLIVSTTDTALQLINNNNTTTKKFWNIEDLTTLPNRTFYGDIRFGNANDDTFKLRFTLNQVSSTQNKFSISLSSNAGLSDFLDFFNDAGINRIDCNVPFKLLSGGTTITPVNSIDIVNKNYVDTNFVLSSYLTSNYYTQTYINTNFYTKTATDTLLNNYVLSSYLTANYYTQTYITTNYYTQTYINTNFYTKSATDTLLTNYCSLGTVQTLTGAKTFSALTTFSNGLTTTGGNIGLNTDVNGMFTGIYSGTAQPVNGFSFQCQSSAVDPFFYFDFANSFSSDTHKFRYAVYRASNTNTQAQFFLSSNSSYPLLNYMTFTRGSSGDFITINVNTTIPSLTLTTGSIYTLPSANTDIVNKLYVTNTLANYVDLTTNQTIGGSKTFSSGATFNALTQMLNPLNITTQNVNPLVVQYHTNTNPLQLLFSQNTGSTITRCDISNSNNDSHKFRTKLDKVNANKSVLSYYLSSSVPLVEANDVFMSVVNDVSGGGIFEISFDYKVVCLNDLQISIGDLICDNHSYLTSGTISTTPTGSFDIVNKNYVDTNFVSNSGITGYCTLATDQTITGYKTINNSLKVRDNINLGNNTQSAINFSARGLIMFGENLYMLGTTAGSIIRVGTEAGGAGELMTYRNLVCGLGDPNGSAQFYVNNGRIYQWRRLDQVIVNSYRNSWDTSTYAQIITDNSINTTGDASYLYRMAVERNSANDIRIYHLLSDGVNPLLTFDEIQRIDGNIIRYFRNSDVILNDTNVMSAINVMPVLNTRSDTGVTKWLPQSVKKYANTGGIPYNQYVSYVYKIYLYNVYNYTNYKRFNISSMSSNTYFAVNYRRVNYYSFMSYGDSHICNLTNIRFGISSRPPNLVSGGGTGNLWYGMYDVTTALPPQFNYLTRFYKSGSYYKANTNIVSDSANPVPINLLENKRYIYTCSWSYDYSSAQRTLYVATCVTEIGTHYPVFYDVVHLTPYNNTGQFLDCTDVSPMICVTNETQGKYLEFLTQIDQNLLASIVGVTDNPTNAVNVFDP